MISNLRSVVGLDLSLTSSGVSCEKHLFTISVASKGAERLHDISTQLEAFLNELNNPSVVIEGYSFASRNSHAHAIGELGGVVRLSLWRNQIPYVEVPPTCRAKFATGRGNAGKSEVVSAVSARTGIVWSGKGADDLCDAFVLEEMGLVALGRGRFSWPETHRSALAQIDWSSLSPI